MSGKPFAPLKWFVFCLIGLFASGCAMSPKYDANGHSYVEFGDKKLLSLEQAKKLPRDERMKRIEQDMKKIPARIKSVSPIYDRVNYAILSVFNNQKALFKEYKVLVDEHKDVMSFIKAHEGKSEQEILELARQYDRDVVNTDQRVSLKLRRYQRATDKIQLENVRLAGELLIQATAITLMLKDNFQEMLEQESVMMILQIGRLNKALQNMNARLHMAKVANEFIEDEKAVLDITKQLQKIIDNQL